MFTATQTLLMALDRCELARALGVEPDPWQRTILESEAARILLNVHRQGGKSSVCACLGLHAALFEPESLVLIVSRAERQAKELFLKMLEFYRRLGKPAVTTSEAIGPRRETALTLSLENGSRIVALPGDGDTIRSYSAAKLVLVDEASRVRDDLFAAVSPMLAVSRGRLIALSTPAGKRGHFYEQWTHRGDDWLRIQSTAWECPRITREFLEAERRTLGDRWFRQEYECSFEEVVDQVFSTESIDAAFNNDEVPLFERLAVA